MTKQMSEDGEDEVHNIPPYCKNGISSIFRKVNTNNILVKRKDYAKRIKNIKEMHKVKKLCNIELGENIIISLVVGYMTTFQIITNVCYLLRLNDFEKHYETNSVLLLICGFFSSITSIPIVIFSAAFIDCFGSIRSIRVISYFVLIACQTCRKAGVF